MSFVRTLSDVHTPAVIKRSRSASFDTTDSSTKIKSQKINKNLFIDRLEAYKEFGLSNDYENILCMDFSDIYVQNNPFEILNKLPQDHIVLSSEGVIIGDQNWNRNVINNVYGEDMLKFLNSYEILNCGVMYGTPQKISEFADIVIKEFEEKNST